MSVLTEVDIIAIRSMAQYWKEVRKRPDNAILDHEAKYLADRLGYKLLLIVEEWLCQQK